MATYIAPDAAGSHLSPFERLLGAYVMALPHGGLASLADLARIDVTHEEAFETDSTAWPSETYVVYQLFSHQLLKNGTRRTLPKHRTIYVPANGPVDFFRDLINGEI